MDAFTVFELFELEVVHLADECGVGVDDLAVQELERSVEAPSGCGLIGHAPPFVAIISGIVAIDTTMRMPK